MVEDAPVEGGDDAELRQEVPDRRLGAGEDEKFDGSTPRWLARRRTKQATRTGHRLP